MKILVLLKEDDMKVLEVISSLAPTGGGETFAVNLSCELSSRVDLAVVVLHRNNKSFFINRLKEKGIEPIILNKKGHLDSKNIKQLRKLILNFKPDVIHTENNAIISTYLALNKTKLKHKINVFHTMHLLPEKECNNFVLRFLYKHIFKKSNFIPVGITEQLANISKVFYKRNNVPFVNNGSNLENFKNNKELQKRKYDVVVVGRFSREKNHRFLLNSFKELSKTHPNVKIALVGGGELFEDIKKLSSELKLDSYVEFKGVMSDPSSIVNDSKIITLGSLYEANPLTLIEGMSSGCIVVANAVGGIPEIVKDKKNGFLYNTNDMKSYVTILCNVLDNIDEFTEMSECNSKYAQNYSMKNCAKEYLNLFNSYGRDN